MTRTDDNMADANQNLADRAGPLLAGLTAPLAAVSTRYGGARNAQIAVAITAASIVPQRPRLIVQLYHTNYTHELVAASGIMAVNFLEWRQLPLIWQLGMRSGRDGDKLAAVPHQTGVTGAPLLDGCFGWLDCRVVNAMDGGDLTAFLVEVLDAGSDAGISAADQGRRRMSWREARPRLPSQWAAEWERKMARETAISLARMGRIDPAARPGNPPSPPHHHNRQ